MNIFENIHAVKSGKCTNCFEATKDIIHEFFDYLDCNEDRNINAENIYWGMTNMEGLPFEHTTTTMVNDFVLNTMEHASAALDPMDFCFGLLVGMYERVISKDGISEINLNSMKVARREVIDGGGGPARR